MASHCMPSNTLQLPDSWALPGSWKSSTYSNLDPGLCLSTLAIVPFTAPRPLVVHHQFHSAEDPLHPWNSAGLNLLQPHSSSFWGMTHLRNPDPHGKHSHVLCLSKFWNAGWLLLRLLALLHSSATAQPNFWPLDFSLQGHITSFLSGALGAFTWSSFTPALKDGGAPRAMSQRNSPQSVSNLSNWITSASEGKVKSHQISSQTPLLIFCAT